MQKKLSPDFMLGGGQKIGFPMKKKFKKISRKRYFFMDFYEKN